MEYRSLGASGLIVSRLCYGTLTLGKMHADLNVKDGARLLRTARDLGVNFFDSATIYDTYPFIREAFGNQDSVVIASRTYAADARGARRDLEYALGSLGRDRIDVFGLHEQFSKETLHGHRPALEFLMKAKEQGKIGALLVSTHYVRVVVAAGLMEEIDVLHPLFNIRGMGIRDGTADDMARAISAAHAAGKGIYSMKALAGGHLSRVPRESLDWVASNPDIDSVAVGMGSVDEVTFAAALFSGKEIPPDATARLGRASRRVTVEGWCSGCGSCVKRCPQGAIELLTGKARVDQSRCLFCGYCASACESFCIKVMQDENNGGRCR